MYSIIIGHEQKYLPSILCKWSLPGKVGNVYTLVLRVPGELVTGLRFWMKILKRGQQYSLVARRQTYSTLEGGYSASNNYGVGIFLCAVYQMNLYYVSRLSLCITF